MFSTQPNNIPTLKENRFQKWKRKFFSQPHQPFFTSGILFFILFLFLITSNYTGLLSLDSSLLTYHAYTMIYVVLIQFFLGFLFTVFPRFLAQAEINIKTYTNYFYIYFLSSIMILLTLIFYSKITIIFQVLMLVIQIYSFRFLYNIHKSSLVQIKEDTKWVLIGFLSGLIGHFLFIVSSFDFTYSYELSKLSINIGFYLFLFVIVFSISQRMIPFFTTAKDPTYIINKSKDIVLVIFLLLVLKVLFLTLENSLFHLFADISLFIVITKELIKWKLPLFKVPAIMWILYLALYWIPIGFLLSIIESASNLYGLNTVFEKAALHIFALGYFTTALLGFGTRVILGHSGNTPYANKFTVYLYFIVQLVVILRVFASLSINFSDLYIVLLNISSLLLIVILFLWSSKYIAILLKGK